MRRGALSIGEPLTGLVVVGFAGLLIASGWVIADEHAKALLIALAIAGLCVLAFTQRGAFIGILVLATMNGLPFVDTSTVVTSKITAEDVAVIVLVLTAGAWILFDSDSQSLSRTGRAVSRAGVLLLLWWLFTMARTVVGEHISVLHAASFGRDFVFFALLLILLPRVRLTSRDIGVLLGILVAGVCLFALGQIMIATGLGQLEALVHYHKTLEQSGLTRLYAHMTDLVTAALAVSVAASLLARQRMVRLVASPVALLLTISIVVQLTRARWIGLVAGVIFVSLWLMINGEARNRSLLRRRLALFVGALGLAGMVAILAAPAIISGGTVIQRLVSIFSDLENSGGTVAIRETVTRTMTAYLGEKWPLGLGFIPPSAHYFSGLPEGSIRDADLGVLNAVMTMGVIGAALIYVPVLLTLMHCLRRCSAGRDDQHAWLYYGGAVWIAATLVSSVTLVTLYSTSGLAMTAVAITILTNPSVSEEPVLAQARTRASTPVSSPATLPNPITVVPGHA